MGGSKKRGGGALGRRGLWALVALAAVAGSVGPAAAAEPGQEQAPAGAAAPAAPAPDLPEATVRLSKATDEFEGEQLAAKVALADAPVVGAAVEFSTPRLFGTLVLGEAETDGEGVARLPFPHGLPGDAKTGVLTLTARVVRSTALCGEDTRQLEGGAKLEATADPFPREIWGRKADLHLLLTIPVLISLVWSVYAFALSQLVRIFRGRAAPTAHPS